MRDVSSLEAGAGPDAGRLVLALTGDVMLGRLVDAIARTRQPSYVWGNVLPLSRGADLTLVNLECVIATSGRPWTRTPKVFHFRAGTWALDALMEAGVDFVGLANNHVLDYEEDALLEMLDHLDARGIARAGAGRNSAEAARPAVRTARGLRVSVLSFTDNEPVWAAGESRPGVNYQPVTLDPVRFRPVREAIRGARSAGADVLVFSNHWGPNMRRRPPAEFRSFARAVIDAGADIYVGHSAHVLQGVELYRGRPIFYDLGDFVDDYAVDEELRNDLGALALVTWGPGGVEKVELVPTAIDRCQVNLATGADFEHVAETMRTLSAEMGTEIVRANHSLRLVMSGLRAA